VERLATAGRAEKESRLHQVSLAQRCRVAKAQRTAKNQLKLPLIYPGRAG
jgi:hypothetical protein